ncbi:MAG TPA: hypothetical protein VMU25_02040 [Candidatus Paceibacterota bacterium]|nr:hypothetical protein [Candidatus Paceibacterota bacterium]
MKFERAILIAFLGNYLVNNVVAAIAAFVPTGASTWTSPQYYVFIVLAAILVGLVTWWYMKMAPRTTMAGLYFGITGFVVSIAVAFITGISGVLIQTASISTLIGVLPNFGPFLFSVSTLVLLGYWIVPAVLVGWWLGKGSMGMPSSMNSSMNTSMPPRTM